MLLSCRRCRQWQQEIDPAPAGPFLCPVCGASVADSAWPAAGDSEGATLAPASAPAVAAESVTAAAIPVAQPDRPAVPGYEVLGELGRGGMGVVYKARQAGLNRLVALKMILSGLHAAEAERDRFRAEAEAVARLQHPNIVQIYEVGESGGCPFFSLEFVEGGSLADKLDGTPWQPRPAAELVETLARAMHAAHKQGVVHRDLKPANVLLTGRRPTQDHRLRPGQAAGRRGRPDAERRHPRHAQLHGSGASRRQDRKRSARRPTFMRWGRSCTSC